MRKKHAATMVVLRAVIEVRMLMVWTLVDAKRFAKSEDLVSYASTSIFASAVFPLCHLTSATPVKITSMAPASRAPKGSR